MVSNPIRLVLNRKTVVQQDRVKALHDNIIIIIIISLLEKLFVAEE